MEHKHQKYQLPGLIHVLTENISAPGISGKDKLTELMSKTDELN